MVRLEWGCIYSCAWPAVPLQVCTHFAEKILLTPEAPAVGEQPEPALVLGAPWAGTLRMPQARFTQRLKALVPPPFEPSLELLQSEVLVEGGCTRWSCSRARWRAARLPVMTPAHW